MIATKRMGARIALAGALLVGGFSASANAADMTIQTIDCAAHRLVSYTLRRGDSCLTITSNPKFHFTNFRQIELINRPLTGFTCARAAPGQIICYPPR